MKIKNYQEFITESFSSPKTELLAHFDENKKDILQKGLNFDKLRMELSQSLELLDDNFLRGIINQLSSIDLSNKEEFVNTFSNVLNSILHQMDDKVDEGFISGIKSIWQGMKDTIYKSVKWLSDRIFTISGIITLGLGAVLFLVHQYGGGISYMPGLIGNAVINIILTLGLTALSLGIKYEVKQNESEI